MLTVRPGSGPPPITKTRSPMGGHPDPVARGQQVVEPDPAPRCDAVGKDLRDRPVRLLAAGRDDVAEQGCRARPSTRVRHGLKPAPAPIPWSIRLEMEQVRVEPRRPPGDGVDGSRERRHAEMLARSRAGNDRPAPRAEVERERVPREPLGAERDAARDDDLPAGDTGAGRSARERHRRECPPRALVQDEHGSQWGSVDRVAAQHVRAPAGPHRHRVMHADREIRQSPPAVPRRRVRVHPRRRSTIDRESSEHDDLAADRGGGHLGARKRHRSSRLPCARRGETHRNEHQRERDAGETDHGFQGTSRFRPGRRRA